MSLKNSLNYCIIILVSYFFMNHRSSHLNQTQTVIAMTKGMKFYLFWVKIWFKNSIHIVSKIGSVWQLQWSSPVSFQAKGGGGGGGAEQAWSSGFNKTSWDRPGFESDKKQFPTLLFISCTIIQAQWYSFRPVCGRFWRLFLG